MAGKGLSRQQRRALEREHGSLGPAGRSGGVTAVGWSFRSGPLPDPKELAELDQVAPGTAKVVVDQFALQSDHRREIESIVVRGNDRRANRGQWMAFVIAMTAIGGGIYLSANDKPTEGLVLVISGIAGLVAVFITGKVFQERERKDKREGK